MQKQGHKKNWKDERGIMKEIKLYRKLENAVSGEIYELNPSEKYIINMEDELEYQLNIMGCFQIMDPPPAIKNYHAWLFENGFDVDSPNPTNAFVEPYYGVKPLWKTEYSQGIVVKAEGDSDYFIVMECSNKNKGYRHTKVILTMGGCI